MQALLMCGRVCSLGRVLLAATQKTKRVELVLNLSTYGCGRTGMLPGGPRSRGALGTYNFAGDLGKMALPSLTAGLIAVMSWHSAASIIGVIGLLGTSIILLLLRSGPMEKAARTPAIQHEAGGSARPRRPAA